MSNVVSGYVTIERWIRLDWPAQKGSTMANTKRASKRKRRRIALPALGAAAGASLIMGDGASATAPTATSLQDTALLRPVVTLDEEEVADVSLGTFYVFDKENE